MGSATVTSNAAALNSVGNALQATRDQVTCSGETRSELFRRLRAEFVWQDAEVLKEQARAECRNRGMNKRDSGIEAWNSIAATYPKPDAVSWNAFDSRSVHPPLISTVAEVTDNASEIAGSWSGVMKLSASLASRCTEIGERCLPLLEAIDARQQMEPADSLIIIESAIRRIEAVMIEHPNDLVSHTKRLFSAYESNGTAYSEAVSDELRKYCQFMELMPSLIKRQWPTVSVWLWGPRSSEVIRQLTRACEA
jgi:hypothetical protein